MGTILERDDTRKRLTPSRLYLDSGPVPLNSSSTSCNFFVESDGRGKRGRIGERGREARNGAKKGGTHKWRSPRVAGTPPGTVSPIGNSFSSIACGRERSDGFATEQKRESSEWSVCGAFRRKGPQRATRKRPRMIQDLFHTLPFFPPIPFGSLVFYATPSFPLSHSRSNTTCHRSPCT